MSAKYVTPGAPADMSIFAQPEVADLLGRRPTAWFPANLAVIRVQGPGYRSATARGYGYGGYSVVTTRDIETDAQYDRLGRLPGIDRLARINRLLLPARLETELDVRKAAAALHADLVLLYTLDTEFHVDKRVKPAGIITLGLFPTRKAHVLTTASAVLVDTRSGFVYATAEATSRRQKAANYWSSEQAVDDSRRLAETDAFDQLLDEIEQLWPAMLREQKVPGRTYRTG